MYKCEHCGAYIIEPNESIDAEWLEEPFYVVGSYGYAVHELDAEFCQLMHDMFGWLYRVLDKLVDIREFTVYEDQELEDEHR